MINKKTHLKPNFSESKRYTYYLSFHDLRGTIQINGKIILLSQLVFKHQWLNVIKIISFKLSLQSY